MLFRSSRLVLIASLTFICAAFPGTPSPSLQPSIWASQPDAVAFVKMEDEHLAETQRLLDRMLAVHEPRTLENTLRPYDGAVRQLNSAGYLAGLMQAVHPDAAFRDRATAMVEKVGAVQTALSLNKDVYLVLKSLDISHADAATQHYLQRTWLAFHLAGVDKDESQRAELRKLKRSTHQSAVHLRTEYRR